MGCLVSFAACCKRKAGADGKFGMLPNSERKCRDTLCCLLFALFWVGMVVIAGIAFHKGNPQRLLYGTDYNGNVCNQGALKDLKYIVYPRTAEDSIINLGKNPLDMKFYGVCVSSCPKQLDVVCNYNVPAAVASASASERLACLSDPTNATSFCPGVRANCWATPVDTSSTLFHCLPVINFDQEASSVCVFPSTVSSSIDPRCIIAQDSQNGTSERPAHQSYVFSSLSTARASWSRYFGDIQRTWYVIIICGVLIAAAFSLLWLLFMKLFTGLMVFLAVFLTICICIAITLFCYFKGGILHSSTVTSLTDSIGSSYSTQLGDSLTQSSQNQGRFKVAAYVFTGITVIVMCLAIGLRHAIYTAVNVIKLGVRAVSNNPGTIFFPVFTVIMLCSLLVWWVFVAAAIASSGKVTLNQVLANSTLLADLPNLNATFATYGSDNVMNYFLIYHFFGLLWTNQFIQGIGMCTIAGACAGWYFSVNEAGNPEADTYKYAQPRFATWQSFLRTIRYNLGSIAFGSLLIAIVQAVRAALAYLQRQSKQLQNNQTMKAIACCIQCCLRCLQTFIEVVTRNAYIYISLKGVGFCEAGRNVFMIMANNLTALAIVNMLSEIITFLGKIFVACVSGFACFWYIEKTAKFGPGGSEAVSSSWLPVIISMLFGYCIASGFLYVYDIAVDTVLVCHIVDCEENVTRHNGEERFKVPIHFKADHISSLQVKVAEPVVVKSPAAGPAGSADGGYGASAVPPHTSVAPQV